VFPHLSSPRFLAASTLDGVPTNPERYPDETQERVGIKQGNRYQLAEIVAAQLKGERPSGNGQKTPAISDLTSDAE
jgi:hypothetical protein